MTRQEVVAECKRIKKVLRETKSQKLRNDYGKYLKRLQKRLSYTDD